MIFGKRNKNNKRCEVCGSKTSEKHSFCPYCGNNMVELRDKENYGLLGKNDFAELGQEEMMPQGFGVMDKLFSSVINNMMKNLDKQFKEQFNEAERPEVAAFPNGIRIKISGPFDMQQKKKAKQKTIAPREIDAAQIKKMSSLPRTKAKTSVKRFGDRVVYELSTPGVNSSQDVFVSKLENGYEVKAIGDKKIYVNSVPINLPLQRYTIMNNKLLIEFLAEQRE